MPTLRAETLTDFASRIFQAAGAPVETADLVAASLVDSNLVGHDSHGVVRVVQYLASIEQGQLDPLAQPTIRHETSVIALIDAHSGFGQVAAHKAMRMAIDKAKEHGLAATGLVDSGHVGRMGEWVEMAAREGLISLAFCNGGGGRGIVAPFGGVARILGTNPIAAAVPVANREPVVLDFATSAVAEGKVRIARNSGKSIPEGWILDKDGNPSTRPDDLYDGGVLLPSAGHKGYGLSLLVEFLAGLLTTSGVPVLGMAPRNGVLFMVINVDAFRPLADFMAEGEAMTAAVKAAKPAPGFDEVLLPGEPEARSALKRRAQGVYLDDTTWAQLVEAGRARGVEAPELN